MTQVWIPVPRLLRVLDQANDLGPRLTNSERRFLYELRTGRQEYVSLGRVDNLLSRLDMTDWLHLPEEMGGLADIYVEGKQYGRPNHLASSNPKRSPRKYATEAERLEARRKTYRDYYQRRKAAA